MLKMLLERLGADSDSLGELWIHRDGVLERQPVKFVTAEVVETTQMALPRERCTEYVTADGRKVWLANLSLPAQVAAEEIRRLRHSAILSSLFRDDTRAGSVPLGFWVLVYALVAAVVLVAR